jgi:hypothetical protein
MFRLVKCAIKCEGDRILQPDTPCFLSASLMSGRGIPFLSNLSSIPQTKKSRTRVARRFRSRAQFTPTRFDSSLSDVVHFKCRPTVCLNDIQFVGFSTAGDCGLLQSTKLFGTVVHCYLFKAQGNYIHHTL